MGYSLKMSEYGEMSEEQKAEARSRLVEEAFELNALGTTEDDKLGLGCSDTQTQARPKKPS